MIYIANPLFLSFTDVEVGRSEHKNCKVFGLLEISLSEITLLGKTAVERGAN